MFLYCVNALFTTYTFMLFGRVLCSWFPSLSQYRLARFLAFYTDPYLNLFRRIIPPIGMVDISPMFAFFALRGVQMLLTTFLR